MIVLRYVGNGFIPGVPAKDLTEAEIREVEKRTGWKDVEKVLVESGLYVSGLLVAVRSLKGEEFNHERHEKHEQGEERKAKSEEQS